MRKSRKLKNLLFFHPQRRRLRIKSKKIKKKKVTLKTMQRKNFIMFFIYCIFASFFFFWIQLEERNYFFFSSLMVYHQQSEFVLNHVWRDKFWSDQYTDRMIERRRRKITEREARRLSIIPAAATIPILKKRWTAKCRHA